MSPRRRYHLARSVSELLTDSPTCPRPPSSIPPPCLALPPVFLLAPPLPTLSRRPGLVSRLVSLSLSALSRPHLIPHAAAGWLGCYVAPDQCVDSAQYYTDPQEVPALGVSMASRFGYLNFLSFPVASEVPGLQLQSLWTTHNAAVS